MNSDHHGWNAAACRLLSTRRGAFSGVLSMSSPGVAVLRVAGGFANPALHVSNSIGTAFSMAGGSKVFTAAAVCRLCDTGLIDLDDEVEAVLPELRGRLRFVTVRQLLTHTSGIPDYFDEEVTADYAALWRERPMYRMSTPRDFVSMFCDGEAKFEPGGGFAYSNSGFIVLGLMLEKISGLSFVEYVEREVLDRAGMCSSGYFRMDELPGHAAIGQLGGRSGQPVRSNVYSVPVRGRPDGGAYTTAADMEAFWWALTERRLLSTRMCTALFGAQVRISRTTYHGFGTWLERVGGHEIAYVVGREPGAAFASGLDLNHGTVTTVLSNIETDPYEMLVQLMAI